MKVMKVSAGILKVFKRSRSWQEEKKHKKIWAKWNSHYSIFLILDYTNISTIFKSNFIELFKNLKRMYNVFLSVVIIFLAELPPTWKTEYIITVRGRFPENSAILKMSRPQRLMSSISWRGITDIYKTLCFVYVCESLS